MRGTKILRARIMSTGIVCGILWSLSVANVTRRFVSCGLLHSYSVRLREHSVRFADDRHDQLVNLASDLIPNSTKCASSDLVFARNDGGIGYGPAEQVGREWKDGKAFLC
jgi:hypothetical protein